MSALSIPAGKSVAFRIGALVFSAVAASFHKKGMFVVVTDLMNQGTEGIVNLRLLTSWVVKDNGAKVADTKKDTSKDSSAAFWLQDRLKKIVTVAAPGMKDAVRGVLANVYEEAGIGIFFEVKTEQGVETFQWTNVLFVRHRPVVAKPASTAKPTAENSTPTAKPAGGDTAEMDFEVDSIDPEKSMIGEAGGNTSGDDNELGLAPEEGKK